MVLKTNQKINGWRLSDLFIFRYFCKPLFSLLRSIFFFPFELFAWFFYSSLWIIFGLSFPIIFLLYPFWLLCYWLYSVFSPNKCRCHRRCHHSPSSSISVLPCNCMVLSTVQLSMWFASLLRLMDTFLRISLLWQRFKMEFILSLIPLYEYVLTKIKEPPKGIIRAIIDFLFVLSHFLVLFFGYILAILCLGIKKTYSFVFSFKFSDIFSRSPTSQRYTIFQDDGITLNTPPIITASHRCFVPSNHFLRRSRYSRYKNIFVDTPS